jgi:hypothetical protein
MVWQLLLSKRPLRIGDLLGKVEFRESSMSSECILYVMDEIRIIPIVARCITMLQFHFLSSANGFYTN